ncbi:MAG: hypothetical protein CMJ78_26835 [Planctomycetaceae bacterium]|nr:hypothetical protein [Planctomycetaceae bacterium]
MFEILLLSLPRVFLPNHLELIGQRRKNRKRKGLRVSKAETANAKTAKLGTPAPAASANDTAEPADGKSSDRLTYGQLWRLGGISPWKLAYRAFHAFWDNHLDARSAQFAYTALMTIAPLFIVVLALVAQLPLEGVLDSFLTAIDVGMPESVVTLISQQITDIQAQSTIGLITLGLFLLGFFGSRVFLSLGAGLDEAYGIENGRHMWKQSLLALSMTLGVLFLLLLAMILLVVGPMVIGFLTDKMSWLDTPRIQFWLSSGVRWSIASAFLLISATFIYWVVPGRKMPWYWLSPGNVFATVGWVGVTQGFQVYVENFGRYNETYGALGGVVVLLIWLYFTGFVLLMGGQINSVIEDAAREKQAA